MIALNARKRKSRRSKRARRHNPSYSYNRKHRRSRSRRNNPAVSVRRPLGALTAGFKPSVLIDAGVVTAGAFGNHWLRNQVASRLPATFQSGLPSYGVGLATAGAMLFVPKFGNKLFVGAVLEEVMRAVSQYVPNIPKMLGEYLTTDSSGGMQGLEDYLNAKTPGLREYLDTKDPGLQGDEDDDGLDGMGVGDEVYEGAASTFE